MTAGELKFRPKSAHHLGHEIIILILKSVEERWAVPVMQHSTLLMLTHSWVNVSITSSLWMYFIDMLEYITL